MSHSLQQFFAAMPGKGPHNWHPPVFYGKMIGAFAAVCLLLGLLHVLPRQYRKWIIGLFTFLAGLYYATEFFWPSSGSPSHNWLTDSQDLVSNISAVVGSFAIGVGVVSLLQLHASAIVKQKRDWGFSIVLIASFFAMLVFGLLDEYAPKAHVLHTSATSHDVFTFLFDGGFVNLGSAMFSIIAFFIASASYRAFRIKSLESSFLMITALIVMLGSVTFGVALTQWIPPGDGFAANFRIERVAQWILLQVNSPAQRGILFGLAVGELAVALRLWLSLERGAYFDQEL